MEIWKDIDGFDNYEVSTFGNVRNKKTGYLYSRNINGYGYSFVNIKINNKQCNWLIHRLVAKAFIPNPDNKPEVDHKDSDKTNNNLNNLRWATRQENEYNKQQTRNAKYISKHGQSVGYNIRVYINGKPVSKYARTIEEAEIIRDELLEQRNREMAGLAEFIYPSSL